MAPALLASPAAVHQLIPAYVPPAELVALAPDLAPGSLVIVNPASGVGPAFDPGYAEACDALAATGATVLGYVATGYGRRSPAEVGGEAEAYRARYGVDGVFLDEAPSGQADLAGFAAVVAAAGDGVRVLNPGVVPHRDYHGLAEVVVTFEGALAAYGAEARCGPRDVDPARTARLVHAAEDAGLETLRSGVPEGALVYGTPGRLPNPWAVVRPMADESPAVAPDARP